jgi:Domain of unknown function (DUF932)
METMAKTQWEELRGKIALDDEGKVDWTVPIKDVRMNRNGVIGDKRFDAGSLSQIGASKRGVVPNDHAQGQLFSRVGIPAQYGKRCYEEDNKNLIASQFNYWMENAEKIGKDVEEDKSWLLRGKNDSLRGVLSDKYTQLDNSFVFDALGMALDSGDAVQTSNFFLEDKYLNMRLVFPDLTHNIGTMQKPDDVMVGVHITNSEVGASSLRIDACLFRLVCSNGMIARVGGDSLMMQRHIHLSVNEMQSRVSEAIGKAMQVGDKVVEDFARSREVKIESPLELLKKLAEKQKYSEKFTRQLETSFHEEPGDTAFHVVNALTHASQTLPFERRLEVETYAGKWMQDTLKYA